MRSEDVREERDVARWNIETSRGTESPFFTASLKVNERWFDKDERALPISIVNTGSQIANAIAPP
ncbi:hypothetical protein, partial [Streptomyces sp. Agncl-13]|uniref:hypothetical protein n=1 Tax=Streptomyces sp. Agncl-13 TaxID=3400628 RepID=UPI003A8ADDA2